MQYFSQLPDYCISNIAGDEYFISLNVASLHVVLTMSKTDKETNRQTGRQSGRPAYVEVNRSTWNKHISCFNHADNRELGPMKLWL